MTRLHQIIWAASLGSAHLACGQSLETAEVRIPYQELKRLLAKAEPAQAPSAPKPALLSSKLMLSLDRGSAVIDASFRCTSFEQAVSLVPLVSGDVTLVSQEPSDARIMMEDDSFCLAMDRPGTTELKVRLLASAAVDGFKLSLPACASSTIEVADLPDGRAFQVNRGQIEETLASGQSRPVSNNHRELKIRLLDDRESRDALSSPEPSSWTWQQQTLVIPSAGDLIYQSLLRASALDGSGVEARLPLPSDAQDVEVSGEDLISQSRIRGGNRSLELALLWKNRGVMDRQVLVTYRMPLRPLDRTWKLQAPGDGETKTRFIIAASPLLKFASAGLTGPLTAQGLPEAFVALLNGGNCYHLETGASAELTAIPVSVVPTADGVVSQSAWSLKVEPDGAAILTGDSIVEHKEQIDFNFDTPPGMKLLSCEVSGKAVSPADLGEGRLQLTLAPAQENTRITCSFTQTGEALDPVEGTMRFSLPKSPLFIHSIRWDIDLPAGYQAETNGNLRRVQPDPKSPAARISLRKNLCRDERPEIQIFYQRSDLNH